MAPYNPGSGSSISGISYANPQSAPTLERAVYGILSSLEEEENNLSKISPQRTDQIKISVDLSRKIASIELILNVVAANVGGATAYTATHYLVGSTFSTGTGGDISAPNLAQAAMEGVVALKLIELNAARKISPEKTVVTRCTHTVGASGGTNATFSALLEFPIEVIILPGGGSVFEGKVFLN